MNIETLRIVPLFESLTEREVTALCDMLEIASDVLPSTCSSARATQATACI